MRTYCYFEREVSVEIFYQRRDERQPDAQRIRWLLRSGYRTSVYILRQYLKHVGLDYIVLDDTQFAFFALQRDILHGIIRRT